MPITPIFAAIALPRHAGRWRAPSAALRRAFRWYRLCHARAAQRRHLAELDERMLRDAGITPAQAARECAKPWWRA